MVILWVETLVTRSGLLPEAPNVSLEKGALQPLERRLPRQSGCYPC